MKLGIINSAFQQAGIDTATGLKHIARIGFDTVDIFTEAVGISPREISLVARAAQKWRLPIISLPVVAVGLIDFNEPVRRFHLDRCKKFIALARDWGAKNILLVLGEYLWQREVIPPAAQWQWAIATCRHLGDCDGKVHGDLPPGRGVVKFAAYLQAIKELKIDGAVSIELEYSPNPGQIVEWVEEAYRETAKLMALAGLRG